MGPAGQGNYEVGRGGNLITKVIIHTIESTAQSALNTFKTSGTGVSAHYIIKTDGVIWQVVDDNDTAYHAGNYNYNRQSIGIELEGWAGGNPSGDFSWQTDAQYGALSTLVSWLISQYGISRDRASIIGHNQVPSPGSSGCAPSNQWGGCKNHWDPGPWWSWRRLMTALGRTPNFEVVNIQSSSCSVVTLPQSGAPPITNVWAGQRFVAYDSYPGWYLVFLSGREAPQQDLPSGGEFHWDGWIPSSCVSLGSSAIQLEVTGVFPSRLNIRNGTSSTSQILARTIDGKR